MNKFRGNLIASTEVANDHRIFMGPAECTYSSVSHAFREQRVGHHWSKRPRKHTNTQLCKIIWRHQENTCKLPFDSSQTRGLSLAFGCHACMPQNEWLRTWKRVPYLRKTEHKLWLPVIKSTIKRSNKMTH